MPQPSSLGIFLPYQLAWIRSQAPIAIGEKSRRIGWTFASAYRAVDRRLKLGTDLFYSSADLGAAREFIEYCERFARLSNATAHSLGSQIIDERSGISALVLRFSHGPRILVGSSNPKFFRGKGGDADADEFAFHEHPKALFKAMHATARVWGHQLRIWSTHNGDNSYFNTLCTEAKQNAGAETRRGFSTEHFRVSILDAVNQGLVEKIKNLSAPNPTARRDWLEELRASSDLLAGVK